MQSLTPRIECVMLEMLKLIGDDFNVNVVDDGLDLNKLSYEGEEAFENEDSNKHFGKC